MPFRLNVRIPPPQALEVCGILGGPWNPRGLWNPWMPTSIGGLQGVCGILGGPWNPWMPAEPWRPPMLVEEGFEHLAEKANNQPKIISISRK